MYRYTGSACCGAELEVRGTDPRVALVCLRCGQWGARPVHLDYAREAGPPLPPDVIEKRRGRLAQAFRDRLAGYEIDKTVVEIRQNGDVRSRGRKPGPCEQAGRCLDGLAQAAGVVGGRCGGGCRE